MRGWSCKVCSKRISSRLKKNEAWCECIDKALQLIEDHQRIAYTVSLFGTSGNGEAPFRPGHLRWAGSHNDLVELAIALQEQGVIVDATGQRAGYAPLLRLLCDAFGIRVDNIYVKKTFVLDRSAARSVRPNRRRTSEVTSWPHDGNQAIFQAFAGSFGEGGFTKCFADN